MADDVCNAPDPRHPGWICRRRSCNGQHQFTSKPPPPYPLYGPNRVRISGT